METQQDSSGKDSNSNSSDLQGLEIFLDDAFGELSDLLQKKSTSAQKAKASAAKDAENDSISEDEEELPTTNSISLDIRKHLRKSKTLGYVLLDDLVTLSSDSPDFENQLADSI